VRVSDFIRSVANHAVDHGGEYRLGDTVGDDIASDFEGWLADECITPETPPEWFAAWAEYTDQYGEESGPDEEPPDIDDDSHYDPYTGGDDYLREHGEDDGFGQW
jgi:hypothetical protein